MENKNKISKATIIRLIALFLTYALSALSMFSDNAFMQNPIVRIVIFVLAFIVSLINYWFNNDITSAAKISGKFLEAIKDGKITEDEASEMVNELDKSKEQKKE